MSGGLFVRRGFRFRDGLTAGAVVLAGLALSVAPSLAVSGWTSPKQVFQARFDPAHAMVLDSSGYVHIASEGGAATGLWYVSNAPSSGRQTPSWFAIQLTHKLDVHPAISIFHDRVYIAFERRDPDTLASKGIWTITNATGTFVTTKIHAGNDHDPSIDTTDGNWHVVFRNGSSLISMENFGSAWHQSVIDSTCCASPASLRLSASGLGRVAYADGIPGHSGPLHYATEDSAGNWSLHTADSHDTKFAALGIDPAGAPYIAYDRKGSGTWVTNKDGSTWSNLFLSPDHGRPDLSRFSNGNWGVVSTTSAFVIRFTTVTNVGKSSQLITTSHADSGPEVEVRNNTARVVYNLGEGGTGDGLYFTRQT